MENERWDCSKRDARVAFKFVSSARGGPAHCSSKRRLLIQRGVGRAPWSIMAILPVWRAGAARPNHEFGKTSIGGPAQVTVMIARCQESEPEAFQFTFLHRGMSRDVYCGMSQKGSSVLKIHSDDWSNNLTEADVSANACIGPCCCTVWDALRLPITGWRGDAVSQNWVVSLMQQCPHTVSDAVRTITASSSSKHEIWALLTFVYFHYMALLLWFVALAWAPHDLHPWNCGCWINMWKQGQLDPVQWHNSVKGGPALSELHVRALDFETISQSTRFRSCFNGLWKRAVPDLAECAGPWSDWLAAAWAKFNGIMNERELADHSAWGPERAQIDEILMVWRDVTWQMAKEHHIDVKPQQPDPVSPREPPAKVARSVEPILSSSSWQQPPLPAKDMAMQPVMPSIAEEATRAMPGGAKVPSPPPPPWRVAQGLAKATDPPFQAPPPPVPKAAPAVAVPEAMQEDGKAESAEQPRQESARGRPAPEAVPTPTPKAVPKQEPIAMPKAPEQQPRPESARVGPAPEAVPMPTPEAVLAQEPMAMPKQQPAQLQDPKPESARVGPAPEAVPMPTPEAVPKQEPMAVPKPAQLQKRKARGVLEDLPSESQRVYEHLEWWTTNVQAAGSKFRGLNFLEDRQTSAERIPLLQRLQEGRARKIPKNGYRPQWVADIAVLLLVSFWQGVQCLIQEYYQGNKVKSATDIEVFVKKQHAWAMSTLDRCNAGKLLEEEPWVQKHNHMPVSQLPLLRRVIWAFLSEFQFEQNNRFQWPGLTQLPGVTLGTVLNDIMFGVSFALHQHIFKAKGGAIRLPPPPEQ